MASIIHFREHLKHLAKNTSVTRLKSLKSFQKTLCRQAAWDESSYEKNLARVRTIKTNECRMSYSMQYSVRFIDSHHFTFFLRSYNYFNYFISFWFCASVWVCFGLMCARFVSDAEMFFLFLSNEGGKGWVNYNETREMETTGKS